MLFLNILDLVDHKRSRAKSEEHEIETFLPTTVTRFEIPETKPGYPWMELYGALVAAFSFLCCGIVQSYTSGAIYSIQTDVTSNISLSKTNISWIASAPPLAALVGTVLVGPMMEKLGRKRTLTLLCVPFIMGWLIIGLALNVTMIIIGRLITGLALGMAKACAPVYVSETVRPQHRGKLGYLPPIMSAVGVLFGCMFGSSFNWKSLAILMAFFPAVLLLCSLYLPETPHWLISQNQEDQAFHALKQLRYRRRGIVTDEEVRLYKEIQEIREAVEQSTSISPTEYDHIHEETGVRKLLSEPSVRRPAVIIFLLMIFQQFSGISAIIYYMKMILFHGTASTGTAGIPHPPPTHTEDYRPAIFGIVHIIAFFITMPLVDRVGRKPLLIVSGILMAISHVIFAIYLFSFSTDDPDAPSPPLGDNLTHPLGVSLRDNTTSSVSSDDSLFSSVHSWLPLVSLCAYVASFSLASPIPYILMSEMFNLNVRSYLSSAAMLICNISSFIVILLFPFLMYTISPLFTFLLFALFSLQTSVIGWIIPETKGKTLVEIENLFRGPVDFRGKVKATIDVPQYAIIDVTAETANKPTRKY